MDCISTMTQCMSLHAPDQGFPNSVEGCVESPPPSPQWIGIGNFYKRNLIYMVVGN